MKKNAWLILYFLVIAFVLSGCATAPPHLQAGAMGNELVLEKIAANKLNQARAEEEARTLSRVQDIREMISRHPIPPLKCDQPKIETVSPIDVEPGDPLLITGCGFGAIAGEVQILYEGNSPYLAIESWNDNAVTVRIPSIAGFTLPKKFLTIIRTAQGNQSVFWQLVTLNPTMVVDVLYGWSGLDADIDGCWFCSWDSGYYYTKASGRYASFRGKHTDICGCSGIDKFFMNVTLKNNWKFESVEVSGGCDTGDPHTACSSHSVADAYVVEQPQKGDSFIKTIAVGWRVDIEALAQSLIYYGVVLVRGPAGTSPY